MLFRNPVFFFFFPHKRVADRTSTRYPCTRVLEYCGSCRTQRQSTPRDWRVISVEEMGPPLRAANDSVKKNVPFRWTHVHAAAMDSVRDDLIRQIRLNKFDPTKQLVMYSDASQMGIGSFLAMTGHSNRLLSLANACPRPSDATARPCAKHMESSWRSRTSYAPTGRRSSTPTPSRCLLCSKAHGVSSLCACSNKVEGLRFELRYVAGRLNAAADGLSRLGMEGARTLSAAGYAAALDDLLEHLSDSHMRIAGSVWVYMSEYAGAYQRVQLWREHHGRPTAMDK
jgi:hypothetical protein